jgi:hypothetical protein
MTTEYDYGEAVDVAYENLLEVMRADLAHPVNQWGERRFSRIKLSDADVIDGVLHHVYRDVRDRGLENATVETFRQAADLLGKAIGEFVVNNPGDTEAAA